MHYCPECGTEVQDTTKFCPNCGHPLTAAPPKVKGSAKSQGTGTRWNYDRVLGLASAVFGLLLLAVDGLFLTQPSARAAFLLLVLSFAGVGLVSLAAGYSLLRRKEWLEKLRLVVGICSLLLGILMLLIAYSFSILYVVGLLGFLVGFGMLYYPRRHQAKSGSKGPD